MMYVREQILMQFALRASNLPSRTQLIKWLFLAKEETAIGNINAFYDFLPYHYGPFSFVAYRDIRRLINRRAHQQPLSEATLIDNYSIASTIGPDIQTAIREILDCYGRLDRRELLGIVYQRYPWYGSRSMLRLGTAVVSTRPAVYTIGYEGLSIDAFLNHLLNKGIRVVLDVRRNAFSRKFGYSGTSLQSLTQKIGIHYMHFPSAGVPSNERARLRTKSDYNKLMRSYKCTVIPRELQTIKQLAQILAERPSVLLCFEADPSMCHRAPLAEAISAASGLPVRHL